MDSKDYNPDSKVYKRPSVRGIIYRGEEVLLVHSKMYDYYNVPGGGIEDGESLTDALIREVKEETGYDVVPSSIEEYGRVLRRQKDTIYPNGIFEQENFYYFCKVEGEPSELNLVDYEAKEGYTPVWVSAIEASRHNLYKREDLGGDLGMIKRDAKVLDMADLLDDMGALGIVMDCMIVEKRNPNAVFEDCYDHIMRFTNRIQKENPMVTVEGKNLWDEKTKLVEDFVTQLKRDIEI